MSDNLLGVECLFTTSMLGPCTLRCHRRQNWWPRSWAWKPSWIHCYDQHDVENNSVKGIFGIQLVPHDQEFVSGMEHLCPFMLRPHFHRRLDEDRYQRSQPRDPRLIPRDLGSQLRNLTMSTDSTYCRGDNTCAAGRHCSLQERQNKVAETLLKD